MSVQILSETKKEQQRSDNLLVGKPLRRKEDHKLLLGRARFVDDVRLPHTMNSAVFRSSYAHARIKNIDISAALDSPGVRLILTANDISSVGSLSEFETEKGFKIKRPVLARDEVRYFGEPVVFIVADSLYEAEDAAEKIVVDYEPLRPIVDPLIAVQDESPKAHFDANTNVTLVDSIESGASIEEAFASASAIVKLDLINQRLAPSPIEPRGAVAEYDAGSGVLHLWISTQGPFQNKSDIAEILNFPEERIRVIAPEVGGGFGAKLAPYSEDILVCIASMKLAAPVKWIETRSENLSSMTHGRGQLQHVELASNENGRILGLKVRLIGDVGAYMSEESGDATFTLRMCPGQYLIPAYEGEAVIVLTNKVPHSAYRGASRPEAIYLIERAIDALSRKLGMDPVELRIRNFIPKENFPFKSAGGLTYDTGDYSMNLKKALELSRYPDMINEQEKLRSQGRLIGVGIATYVEICAFGPDFPQTAAITVSRSGRVTIISGTSPHGQGHETPLAQIVSDTLGIKLDDISVIYGDTALLPWATFTAGSRSAALGGSAVLMCAEKIKSKMSRIAAKELGAPDGELMFENNAIYSKATPEKKLTFREVASLAYQPRKLPKGMESVLYEFSSFAPPTNTFPFGTHIAMVEIEKATGKTRLLRYAAVDDCGKVINPLIVEGQVHGGVVQGLGQAMLEDAAYDSEGQLLATSFMNYQIPQAEDVPDLLSFRTETPTFANALGVKGIGEAGTIAATPAIANAINDALSSSGVTVDVMPLSMDYVKSLTGSG